MVKPIFQIVSKQLYTFIVCKQKMAEKKDNFKRSLKMKAQLLREQAILQSLSKLSLVHKAENRQKLRKKIKIVSFKHSQIILLNAKDNIKSIQQPEMKQKQNNIKCFEMIYNFKYQQEQNKIEIFHQLLYQFSMANNIVQIFNEFIPYFKEKSTSFHYELGWLIKFASDRQNIYAIKFLSNLIFNVIEQIPQYLSNKKQNLYLAQILSTVFLQLQKKQSIAPVIKPIFTLAMSSKQITETILKVYGKSLVDQLLLNYDYTCEYMIIKLIEKCLPEKQFIEYLIKKLLSVSNQYHGTITKTFATQLSYQASLRRILKKIEEIVQNQANGQFLQFLESRGVSKALIQEVYNVEQQKIKDRQSLGTRMLIEQFKRIRLSENQAEMCQFSNIYDHKNEIHNIYGRKIVKKNAPQD